ncbi:ATP-binding cassette domain-containing protein [Candidatus Poribacteria bacterium]|nr:ATP-binding cassette domain-containing protein [Candidatus Poribacteria bacterium]
MLIEAQDLTKNYKMGTIEVRALRGIDFNVDRGEFVSIMGPSGSGKSTLMDILGCLSKPTDGSYKLDGDEVAKLSENRLAAIRNRKIGFVFQAYNLLPRTSALYNVELPLIYAKVSRRERRRRALEALDTVGLADRVDHKPNEISGGQQQRVAIARALVTKPSIFFADEPTGNLDTKSGKEVMSVFQQLNVAGNTILMVTHENEIAAYSQRIIRLRDGVIEADEKVA